MGKYFGTDGFRGEAGITLTADHAYKVGRFLGWYYNAVRERNGNNEPARIVIGKDTRRSSYMFEYSLVAGLTASGADAYLLHVTTTPSVAYIARVDDFDCGIMISASHNPYYDNGIKLIDCYGEKMPEEILLLVEDYIDGKLHVFDKDWPELPFAHREHIGCTVDYVSGRNRYMGYLISLGIYSFKGIKVGLDCANGSSWNIAKSVFDALGADTYVNASGGRCLYHHEDFKKAGLSLLFIETSPLKYHQFDAPFVPGLSIIDVLMFNSKEQVKELLQAYILVP